METNLNPSPLQTTSDLLEADVDWLVVPVFEAEAGGGAGLGALLGRELAPGDFRAKRFETLLMPTAAGVRARRVLLMGGGPGGEYSTETARQLAAAAVLHCRERQVARLGFVHRLPEGERQRPDGEAFVQAESEGLTLGEYGPGRYKTGQEDHRPNPAATLVLPGVVEADDPVLGQAVERGRQLAHCANLARELVNEPGNLLPPRRLAERAVELVQGTNLTVEVLDESQMGALGMGLLLGVGQGSHERPRLIVLRHTPAGAPATPTLGLVGKGVTFDSGGISIKVAEGMDRMKDDMAGGAAVILAMRAISLLGAPVRVVGVVPAVENMPGGGAIRPGDVLRGAGGRTVEVVNTDAEGRLILGDALWYARELGATHLVDVATLTGACMVALGKGATGVFGRPDAWRERVREAADGCGERAWPMPVFDDYKDLLKSEIADTVNSAGRYGGAITGALFVGEFAGGLPWVHLDIAGTSWNDEAKPYMPKGPTGVGVRTLAELAFSLGRDVRGM